MKKLLNISVAILLAFAGSIAFAEEDKGGEFEGQGFVRALDFGTNSLIVGGRQYSVGVATKVTIDGSFGAFTLLESGMNTRFGYDRKHNGRLELVWMDAYSASYVLPEEDAIEEF